MPDQTEFLWAQVRGNARHWRDLAAAVHQHCVPQWQNGGGTLWGLWSGMFGIASTDLFLMLANPPSNWMAALPNNAQVVASQQLRPTARPTSGQPLSKNGLYVFRFFTVDQSNIDEVVQLSVQAWREFETDAAFAAEPQGLFRDADTELAVTQMLLLTWYDGLPAWERSRQPAAGATENFMRRAALTHSTIAYPAQLIRPSL